MTTPTEPDDPRIEAHLALIRARYGDRLSPEQVERVRVNLAALREAVHALDGYPLTNADEPDSIFHAYREQD